MNLVQIQTVAKGKDKTDDKGKVIPGKTYGVDIEGNVFFPGNGITLVAGHWANIKTTPKQVKDQDGNWVDTTDGKMVSQAVATWESEEAAITASLAKRLTNLKREATFSKAVASFSADLTPERTQAILAAEWA